MGQGGGGRVRGGILHRLLTIKNRFLRLCCLHETKLLGKTNWFKDEEKAATPAQVPGIEEYT